MYSLKSILDDSIEITQQIKLKLALIPIILYACKCTDFCVHIKLSDTKKRKYQLSNVNKEQIFKL